MKKKHLSQQKSRTRVVAHCEQAWSEHSNHNRGNRSRRRKTTMKTDVSKRNNNKINNTMMETRTPQEKGKKGGVR